MERFVLFLFAFTGATKTGLITIVLCSFVTILEYTLVEGMVIVTKLTLPTMGVPVIINTVVTTVKSVISIVPICLVMDTVAVQTMPYYHPATNVNVTRGLLEYFVKQILMIVRG